MADNVCLQPVILHLDIDCFEIQNRKRDADLSQPIVAVNSKGLVLSATKSAKAMGIQRPSKLNLETVKATYPTLVVLIVENDKWGKPESKSKRVASYELKKIVREFAKRKSFFQINIDINSLDDMFIDITFVTARMLSLRIDHHVPYKVPDRLTDNVYYEDTESLLANNMFKKYLEEVEYDLDKNTHLILGGIIAQELAEEILTKTGFRVSIGVSCNKSMAKLATSLHRPQGITILGKVGFKRVSKYASITKITGMGGDTGGELLNRLGRTDMTIAEFKKLPLRILKQHMDESTALKIIQRIKGDDDEAVEDKPMPNKTSVSKQMDRRISTYDYIQGKVEHLCEEMIDRIHEEIIYHRRIGKHFRMEAEPSNDRFCKCSGSFEIDPFNLKKTDPDAMAHSALMSLIENGFRFGKFFVRKFTLSITQFAQLPKDDTIFDGLYM